VPAPANARADQTEKSASQQEGNQTQVPAETQAAQTTTTFGQRLRRYRRDRDLSLSELADAANVSKGYLSSLENNDQERRPSAEVMYALAEALGVTMSDLMGRKLLPAAMPSVPESLAQFAEEANLSEADLSMLAFIQFRGEQPRTVARWRFIYESIRNSAQMDHSG
jgi:transcriptional regulator with XRE-family HTH domain